MNTERIKEKAGKTLKAFVKAAPVGLRVGAAGVLAWFSVAEVRPGGVEAAVSASPLTQAGTVVKEIPTDIPLPQNISYFPDRVQVFKSSDNDTAFLVNLNRGGILIVQAGELNSILGNPRSIDPGLHPNMTELVTVVALTDNVNVRGLTKSGTFARLDEEFINDQDKRDMAGLIDALQAAGEVQVGRTRISGNCGMPNGCEPTRLTLAAAYDLGDGTGTHYNLVSVNNYVRP